MGRQTYTWNDIVLTPEQAAQTLWQAGLRDYNVMAQMVAIAKRESGYRAGVHGSDSARDRVSGDRGLFQINYIHDDNLKRAGIIQRSEDLFDPLINAKAALFLANNGDPARVAQLWGAGPGGWQAGGDPFYGTNRDAAVAAVQNAQNTGLFGPDAPPVPTAVTSGAASGAAGPAANPGTADLGFVNANAQNQRDYYTKQAEFNTKLFELSHAASDLQFNELEANKLYQWAIQGVYEDVNRAQGVFNTREYNELKKNIGNLRNLAEQGKQDTAEYRNIQYALEKKTLDATIGWLNKQRGFSNRTKVLADMESTFIWGEQTRKTLSEGTQRGAVHSRGFGQDLAAADRQRSLANRSSTLARDVDFGRLANEDTQARLQYQGDTARIGADWKAYMNQYGIQQEQFRNQGAQGALRYDQTAKQLWAKARELAAQKELNDKMVGINYKGLQNQRDVGYQQYLQSHHSLENQHTQVGVNQLRDISTLNQQRQQAANDALLSLSPYG